jgi:hypothetical protein
MCHAGVDNGPPLKYLYPLVELVSTAEVIPGPLNCGYAPGAEYVDTSLPVDVQERTFAPDSDSVLGALASSIVTGTLDSGSGGGGAGIAFDVLSKPMENGFILSCCYISCSRYRNLLYCSILGFY